MNRGTFARARVAGLLVAVALVALPATASAAAGALDNSFGTYGAFTDQPAPASPYVSTGANGIAVQSDGKLVVSGSVTNASGHFQMLIMRLNANGTLDASFDASGALGGVPGLVILNPDTSIVTGGAPATSTAGRVAIQADGKIVVAGTVGSVAIGSLPMESIVLRLNPDGSLDQTFASGGEMIHNFGVGGGGTSSAGQPAIQPNGDILIAGTASDASGHNAALVARLTPAGAVDPSFGAGGAFVFQGGQCAANIYTRGGTLLLEPDGSIISGGAISVGSGSCSGESEIAVFKLTTSGVLDPTFGSGGLATVQFGAGISPYSSGTTIARQPDGKLLIAGNASDAAGNSDLMVTRLTAAGAVDTSFGNAGVTLAQPGQDGNPFTYPLALALRPDGSIDLAGYASVANTPTNRFQTLLTRLQPGGAFDLSFGSNGYSLTQFGAGSAPSSTFASAVVQPDGKLVAVGSATDSGGNQQLLVARFLGPAAPTVAIGTPVKGASYVAGQQVPAAFTCTAATGDAIASCTGPVASGAAIDTSTPGVHTFSVTATDSYGQQTTATATYTVASPPPVLSQLSQSHKRWRVGSKRGRGPVGTAFLFKLNTAATVSFTFKRAKRVVGRLTVQAKAGVDRVQFNGRIPHRRKLEPGRYTVAVSARNLSGSSGLKRLAFTITG